MAIKNKALKLSGKISRKNNKPQLAGYQTNKQLIIMIGFLVKHTVYKIIST